MASVLPQAHDTADMLTCNPFLSQRAIAELVQQSAPGDILFIHYSGHGTQVGLKPRAGRSWPHTAA